MWVVRTVLKRAYDRVVGLLGPESQDVGLWPEGSVYAKCAELGGAFERMRESAREIDDATGPRKGVG